jgi:hypothetical protein
MYTNRKGITYTLFKVRTSAGDDRYVMARQSKGVPVDEVPPGFRISESPNGVVSLARDRPSLLRPEEIAAVEAVIARLPKPRDYRVVDKHDRLELYVNERPSAVALYRELVAENLVVAFPGQEARMQELDEQWARFAPRLRFVLTDAERRWFRADELVAGRHRDEWVWLGQEGDVSALAEIIIPELAAQWAGTGLAALAPIGGARWRGAEFQTEPAGTRGRRRGAAPGSVHRLKVTLLGLRPPVWRRVEVPSDFTLGQMHDVIQIAMGWHDSHLHQFFVGDAVYTDPSTLDGWDGDDLDEEDARLAEIAPRARRRFRYEYDFGDSWEHEILVEAVEPPEPGTRYPRCVAGKRACPPEDCGGVWGYVDFLEAIADPKHPAHDDMRDWWGGPFDPEAFDQDAVNRQMSRYR